MTTAYERMISHGMDFGPYTRLAGVFRDRIEGRTPPAEPQAATFVDGVLDMAVVDAIRRVGDRGTRDRGRRVVIDEVVAGRLRVTGRSAWAG